MSNDVTKISFGHLCRGSPMRIQCLTKTNRNLFHIYVHVLVTFLLKCLSIYLNISVT